MKAFLALVLRALLLLILTLCALELALQITFVHLPDDVIRHMPQYLERSGHRLVTEHGAREFPAGEVVNYEVTPLTGDLYRFSCLSQSDAQPFEPYHVSFTRDSHGFRNEEPWPGDVDLVVLGDSFAAAEHIQRPFWYDLSDSMLVLANPDIGTLEQQRLFNAFALPRKPDLVVIAFFAGNDLRDNEFFAFLLRQGITRHERTHQGKTPLDYSVVFHVLQGLAEATSPVEEKSCHYPIVAYTDPPTPVAFDPKFLWRLSPDRETLLQSEMLRLTRTSIREMADELQKIEAELILMYIPPKVVLYWDYLEETSKEIIIELESRAHDTTGLDKLEANLSVQRDVMREMAEEIGISFLDLTPPLAEAIRSGQSPYFFADTHWNQVGHDIARNALLDFLNRSNLEM